MTDEYPRRKLGRAEHWGHTVERRLDNLRDRHKKLSQSIQGFNRFSAASAEEIAQNAERLSELAEDIEDALNVFPRYFTRSASTAGFGVGGGWTNVLQIYVTAPPGFTRCEVSASATAFTTQPPITSGGGGNLFIWPFPLSSVTSEFGPRPPLPYHRGIDFGQPSGTPVIAAADGVVSLRGYYSDWGNYIRIDHSALTGINDCWTGYAHLVSPALYPPGTPVSQGQVIGYVGSTGMSSGPHLHFETATEGTRGDPRDFMPIWEGGGGGTTTYGSALARIVIDGVSSPAFSPFTELGIGPNQMTFPIFGRSLTPSTVLSVSLDMQIPSWYSPGHPANRATLTIQGGYS